MKVLAQNISVSYGNRQVLRGINFEALSGEVNLVIGQNGSGKSTFLRVLAGPIIPHSGSVIYDHIDISRYDRRKRLAAGIVYVRQDDNVYRDLSVLDNLKVASHVAEKGEQFDKTLATAHRLFPALRDLSMKTAGLMSAGEKKQLALAMGFMQDPKVLLIDEPSAGLSPILVEEVMNAISRFATSQKVITILVEQNLRAACGIASNAWLLVNGGLEREILNDATLEIDLARIYSKLMNTDKGERIQE